MVQMEKSWKEKLQEEFSKDYMKNLKDFLRNELEKGKIIYPHGKNIFSAFDETPFYSVKVVIIGQDPYHGPNQAHGLSFSVPRGVKIPPSLVNIYQELEADLGVKPPNHGNLQSWASQGVLLLNSSLTVEKGRAGSHRGRGWEVFTDKVIEKLNEKRENLVFLLWGSPAQSKGKNVDTKRHFVLKAPHPSPLSAYRGFFGCSHFSKCNDYLESKGVEKIDWAISSL